MTCEEDVFTAGMSRFLIHLTCFFAYCRVESFISSRPAIKDGGGDSVEAFSWEMCADDVDAGPDALIGPDDDDCSAK